MRSKYICVYVYSHYCRQACIIYALLEQAKQSNKQDNINNNNNNNNNKICVPL